MLPAEGSQVIFKHPENGKIVAGLFSYGQFAYMIPQEGGINFVATVRLFQANEVREWCTAEGAWDAHIFHAVRFSKKN